jgi:L-methionine (R)-S-oxide reductase
MVHADSALLPSSIRTKRELYSHLQSSLASLLEGQTAWVSNLANASSLLHASLNDWRRRKSDSEGGAEAEEVDPTRGKTLNWTGFYLLSGLFPRPRPKLLTRGGKKVPTLVLGPFHGLPACQAIPSVPGKGVCADGSAVLPPTTVRVAKTDDYRE